MPISSFILRKTLAENGSALRRTKVTQDISNPGSGDTVYDSGLRADGFFPATPVSYSESTLEATVYYRNKVTLRWRLSEVLVSAPETLDFDPVELLIRGSGSGEPITPEDGFFVVSVNSENYVETIEDISSQANPYIVEGNWCYYSLFIKYANEAGDSYYEKATDLSVQIPYNFDSTENLWRRIPVYYRELDQQYALNTVDYAEADGPLYRYVELFGWELDKIRTTIYDTMRVNDPDVVHSSAIDALASQVGLPISKDFLGTTKLRTLLNNAGYLQRNKGTQNSVEAYISALTGCGVTTNYSSGLTTFNVHPMRVNLFTDPFFNQGITSPSTPDSGLTQRKWTELDEGGRTYGWGVYAQISPTGAMPSGYTMSVDPNLDKLTVTFPALEGTVTVLIYSRGEFSYNNNLTYYYSANSSHDFIPRFMESSFVDTTMEGTSPPSSLTYADDWNDIIVSSPSYEDVLTNGARKISASIPSTSAPGALEVFPVYKFNITLSETEPTVLTFQNPLVEYRNTSGVFFTGSNTNGGFVPTAGGAPNAGRYDYHWGTYTEGSSPSTNFSYYTLDGYRSQKVTENIIENNVMPVNMVNGIDYDIIWDVLE
jgi:hypothetical protein